MRENEPRSAEALDKLHRESLSYVTRSFKDDDERFQAVENLLATDRRLDLTYAETLQEAIVVGNLEITKSSKTGTGKRSTLSKS